LVIEMRTSGELRDAVFPGSNDALRRTLREVNEIALHQAAQAREAGRHWAYCGFQTARTWLFLREGHLQEDWIVP